MVEIRWDILRPVDIGGQFNAGFDQSRKMVKEAETQNALRAYAQNPNDPGAVNALMGVDPRLGLQVQEIGLKRQEMAAKADARKTMREAGTLYSQGDRTGARNMALQSGDPELAKQFLSLDEANQKLVAGKYEAAAPVLLKARELPYEQRRAFIEQAAPALLAQGWTIQDLAGFDPTDQAIDAQSATAMTVDQVLKSGEVKWVTGEWGAFATDSRGRPVAPGMVGNPMPQQGAKPPQTQQPNAMPAPQAGGAPIDAIWSAAIQQESSGRPGIVGPQTDYGRAEGLTQMLPATAQEMAQKLGLPWRPDLMRAATPEAAAYQERLGRAYFDEGLQKYGGDPVKALMYYHGGPDERLWGPKTRAHAEAVLNRLGGGQAVPAQMAQATPSIQEQAASGVIQPGQKPPPGYRQAAGGSLEAIPGGPGDKTAETETGLRKEAAQVRQEFMGLPQVKKFQEIRNQTLQIQQLAKSVGEKEPGRAQADMALVFSFMKVLDPASVVRETEYANAQNAAGVPERIRTMFNKARDGQILSPQQRLGMVRAAEDVYRTAARSYNETARQYHPILQELGIKNPKAFAPIAVEGDRPETTQRQPGQQAKPAEQPRIRVLSRRKVQ